MTKNIIISLLAIAIIGLGLSVLYSKDGKLGGGAQDVNYLSSMTQTATTTSGVLPMRVLDLNTGRSYAKITNDSDTIMYLYFGNFTETGVIGTAASTTVGINTGVRLNASGGEYEIDQTNLWVGQVWASSTAASKNIIIIEN